MKQPTKTSLLKKQLKELLDEINYEISLSAHRLSTNFLSDVFRSIFSIEKSLESIEPKTYAADDDPELILLNRLTPFQYHHLPFAIYNNDILCKNYKLFSDIEFLILADLSFSMLYRWCLTRYTFTDSCIDELNFNRLLKQQKMTKMYALKFICSVFVYSAMKNAFKINFVPFNENILLRKKVHNDNNFPAFILNYIDDHNRDIYQQLLQNVNYSENPGLENVIIHALKSKKRSTILLISDFLDECNHFESYMLDLKLRHSVMVVIINDPFEIHFPQEKRLLHLNKSWEHLKNNLEKNISQRILLSRENIDQFNINAMTRRKKLFAFLKRERIPYLDLVTNENESIPIKLEKLNFEILQGY
jgi:hypothetical protein